MSDIVPIHPPFAPPVANGEGGDHRRAKPRRPSASASDPPEPDAPPPAVNIAASIIGLKAGATVEGEITGVDRDRHPILETDRGRFAINPTAGLERGMRARIHLLEVGRQIEGEVVSRNGVATEPPIAVALTLVQPRGVLPPYPIQSYPKVAIPEIAYSAGRLVEDGINASIEPVDRVLVATVLVSDLDTPHPLAEGSSIEVALLAVTAADDLSPVADPPSGSPLARLAETGRVLSLSVIGVVESGDGARLTLRHQGLLLGLTLPSSLALGTKLTLMRLQPLPAPSGSVLDLTDDRIDD